MISCIILAGGKSSRMKPDKTAKEIKGKDAKGKAAKVKKDKPEGSTLKAFMILNEKPLIAYVIETVKKFFPEIIIVMKTKTQKNKMERLISSPRISVIADEYKTYSPILGIKAGLKYAGGESVFVVGCDTPFINGVTIFRMMNKVKKGIDCVVPSKAGEHQPLCAIYKRDVFKGCKPNESLHDLIERSKRVLIPIFNENEFFNINTPEDLEQAEKILEEMKANKK